MSGLGDWFAGIASKVVDRFMGSGLAQTETAAAGDRNVYPGMDAALRRAAAESCVLLKNDGVLPLNAGESVALFGRCQMDWFKNGNGSGGNVHAPYEVSLSDALRELGVRPDETLEQKYRAWVSNPKNAAKHGWWGHWPFSHPEMPLEEADVRAAADRCGTAVVVLGRASGEDRDLKLEPGSYYLADGEERMLELVTGHFAHTVVLLNVGNLPDLSWTETLGDRLSALMVVWMGGMESGHGAGDTLCGRVNPCGKLPDTAARSYDCYPGASGFGQPAQTRYEEDVFIGYRHFDKHPEQVLYPFGSGLSYTTFSVSPVFFKDGEAAVSVRNTGNVPGKEAVLLFCEPPAGKLEKPVRVLVSYAKTDTLEPGMSEEIRLPFEWMSCASYREETHSFVLEEGLYTFRAGETVVGILTLEETTLRHCEPVCVHSDALRKRILERIPEEIPPSDGRTLNWADVRTEEDLRRFLSERTDVELEALTRGHGMMNSPLGVPGNAGVFGGILPSLREAGLPVVSCCDGPAGIRMAGYCSLLPSGTALAATWNRPLVEEVYRRVGDELKARGADVLLAPGMNLHRNPLCGRNFEYFSEDPYLSGTMAASVVNGLQRAGRAACPKHFACNHQEYNRNRHNALVSERALRELYLRNFELCVSGSDPLCLMTSYNKVNGVWSHYHYDLVTTVLRREWGYDGLVMTDWWMRRSQSPEFPFLKNNAYRIRAQVDLLMPGSFRHLAKTFRSDRHVLRMMKNGRPHGLTRSEVQRSAMNTLRMILRLKQD